MSKAVGNAVTRNRVKRRLRELAAETVRAAPAGRDVVVVEDTSTTGGSALTAVEALRKAGAKVVAVAVIVDRRTGAKERIEETAGVPCLYAFSKDELGLD